MENFSGNEDTQLGESRGQIPKISRWTVVSALEIDVLLVQAAGVNTGECEGEEGWAGWPSQLEGLAELHNLWKAQSLRRIYCSPVFLMKSES